MKKIGMITFHMACNYGAVLQAYALQQKLMDIYGEDRVEIIDYYSPAIEDRTKIFYLAKTGKPIRDLLRFIIKFIPKCIKSYKFKIFKKKHLKLSATHFNKDNLNIINEMYVALVTGSDQVWNMQSTNNDKAYFLSFANDDIVKFSYAASVGFENIFKKNEKNILSELQRFQKISLRENIGFKQIASNVNSEVVINLDPTLLLSRNEWDAVRRMKDIKEEYILVYCILPSNNLLNCVRQIAKKENLKVYYISDDMVNNDFKHLRNLSIGEFINWIANAKYIATTSFHGTVFSILYNKCFLVEYETKVNYNYRVKFLLELLEIENRNIESKSFDYSSPIKWKRVKEILELERKKSIEYLKSIEDFMYSIRDGNEN